MFFNKSLTGIYQKITNVSVKPLIMKGFKIIAVP